MTNDIANTLSGKWWTFLVRGIVGLCVAAFAIASPGWVATGLVYVFAAYFIISGVVALFGGLSFTGVGQWWALVLMGIVQAALGIVMLAQPGAGPLALAYLFAIWMITTGSLEMTSAYAMRKYIRNEFWWIVLGTITLAFGFYVILRPELGLLALVYTIGLYAGLAGISLIALAFSIKSVGDSATAKRGVPA
jgi:uncharacterized membrane protein HdeD (DUF308 family)